MNIADDIYTFGAILVQQRNDIQEQLEQEKISKDQLMEELKNAKVEIQRLKAVRANEEETRAKVA